MQKTRKQAKKELVNSRQILRNCLERCTQRKKYWRALGDTENKGINSNNHPKSQDVLTMDIIYIFHGSKR